MPLKHLMELLDKEGIKYASLLGQYNYNFRKEQLSKFETEEDVKIMILQFDTGKESLTLPMAQATIFLDRDFAQGFNEQAEARMTPVNGMACTKYIIDLVMKGTKEEEIYNTLVIKKKSIDAMNLVFKSRKGE
jgi:SNF2 family DNA or RNA helicase